MDNNNNNLLANKSTGITINPEELSEITHDDIGDGLEAAYENSVVLIKDGQLIKGKVVKIEPHEILVDVGYKAEGVIPLKELAIRQDISPDELVSLGEELEAVVLQKEDRDGRLILSKKQAQYEKAWIAIEEIKKADGLIKGVVIEAVKGGLMVDIGIRGFLPASLVDTRRVVKLDQYVGQEIEAKILELDRPRSNVVLSRRAWLEESQREERDQLMEKIMPGDIKEGVVTSVVDFGAFVDLGLMDGLIHVSELSWKRIGHPSEVVSVGDKVKVRILGVDSTKERIALSLRATQQGPWVEFAETHKVGDLVYGRVTKLVAFGAFIQVGDEVEGLVHISELATHRVEAPAEVITPGEELWVKIVEIDVSRRRISLSVKQALEGGEVAAEYQADFGEHAEGTFEGGNPVVGKLEVEEVEQVEGQVETEQVVEQVEVEQVEVQAEVEQVETEQAEVEQVETEQAEVEQVETEQAEVEQVETEQAEVEQEEVQAEVEQEEVQAEIEQPKVEETETVEIETVEAETEEATE